MLAGLAQLSSDASLSDYLAIIQVDDTTAMAEPRNPIPIEYFSDVLCVWAYGAQARVDELKRTFGPAAVVRYRFIPLFAAARTRVQRTWGREDGFDRFNRNLLEIVSGWQHVQVHDDVWRAVRPVSSTTAHVFLKAVQLLERAGDLSPEPQGSFAGRSCFEEALWRVRKAFFGEARDISRRSEMVSIARQLELPLARIDELIDNGEAYAELHLDREAQDRYHVAGSPTFVLDEGRQHLYGNVGYRVIEANVRELLRDPQYGEASWC